MDFNIYKSDQSIYHVRCGDKSSSMLTRYGILKGDDVLIGNCDEISADSSAVSLIAKRKVDFLVEQLGRKYFINIELSGSERIFGLGDSNRESIMLRGMKIVLHKANVKCYGPMPIILSSDGWALLVNTTYDSVFDIGATEENRIRIQVGGGQVDFYLFKNDTLMGLTSSITKITGRPILMPKFAYGFTVVNNESIDVYKLLEISRLFREKEIPCDCMGLEPYWMQNYYDFSVDKKWNKEKFYIPYWLPENTSSTATFFHPLRRMGMNLSLWLCEDYDLIYNEEKRALMASNDGEEFSDDAVELDTHLSSASIYQDKITKIGERWFEHLKKFVDNGAAAFKLDASRQVLEHPDRLWGGKFTDDEVHNVYPVLLAKDMESGHREYTDRRLMINTSCAYVGTQQYAATWAGDTGGGPKTLVSVMNYAMCGHSNSGCDINATEEKSMHYGFLMPWTQQNNWAYWNYPWYLGDKIFEQYKFYANLRSSLFPYLYYTSYVAYKDGIPMLRPLVMVYESERFDEVKNAYMLGDSLYVGVFDMNLKLPEGEWVDYFTGDIYKGACDIEYKTPDGIGGALFVKRGSVIVTMKPQKYLNEKEHEYIINLYPSEQESKTFIYEDDGYTYDYQSGGCALTGISSSGIKDGLLTLRIEKRIGSYSGRENNGHDIANNSIPKISSIAEAGDIKVFVHGAKAKRVMLNGENVEIASNDGGFEFFVSGKLRALGDLDYVIEF